ncbi:PLP-dependent aminotransferase family protein [Actinoplanes teichomyceticus]|uniref:MocR-like pyridoxine biosynthesis transcription factor PdxR n=1 Tax=Actinoplanes teichomyceticus TaxID=1867 RepID=UPI0013DDD32C|nr:PLP-dependent aminotransferase family protein [Actinoplanes teichomyceticus]GIF16714.1 GntR family transcriptional regulator [Actinoplanes teichomyceticus]
MYQQLYEQMRWSIEAGQLPAGTRLPATRTLAKELGVSRNTVLVAYDRLLAEGYLDGRVGSGTVVASRKPARDEGASPPRPAARPELRISRAATRMAEAAAYFTPAHDQLRYPDRPFTLGVPALDQFPAKVWGHLLLRASHQLTGALYTHRDPAGYWPLRKGIAAMLGLMRGVRCTPEQVIVQPSAQTAVHMVAMTLLEPGDQVLVEDPGLQAIRGALHSAGVRLCPVPVDAEGMCIDVGAERYPDARMAVVTPNNHFPLSVRMSEARRRRLLDWARERDGWVVEDDYDGEFWSQNPGPPLHQTDAEGRAIYVGTFSKILFPGMCLAYLVVPPDLAQVAAAVQRATVNSLNILTQAALAEFIDGNHLARHVRRMRGIYAERGEALVDGLRAKLGGFVTVTDAPPGTHLVAWTPDDTDERRLAQLSRESRLRVYPLSSFADEPDRLGRGLVLGYAATPPEKILSGVDRLAMVVERYTGSRFPTGGRDVRNPGMRRSI